MNRHNGKIHIPIVFSTLALLFCCAGCGSSDSGTELSGTYSVSDVSILSDNIEIGERVRVEVFFETKVESDGTPDGVDLVVRIPEELAYIPNSSELYDNSTDDSDTFTPNNIVNCTTGETYLIYNFSDFDLFEHEISGFGQFGLKFLAQGRISTPQTLIGATAGENETFDCGRFFEAEQNEAVEVLR